MMSPRLPLFPDASGQLTLSLAVPQTHPAGRHALTVEVVSHGARLPSQFLDVDLCFVQRPQQRLGVLAIVDPGSQPHEVAQGDELSRHLAMSGRQWLEHMKFAPVANSPGDQDHAESDGQHCTLHHYFGQPQ